MKELNFAFFFRLLTNTKLSQRGLNPYSNVMIKCGVFPPLCYGTGRSGGGKMDV